MTFSAGSGVWRLPRRSTASISINYRVGHALRLVGQAGAALARFVRAVTISNGLPQNPNAAEDLAFLTYETAMLAYDLGTVDASTWDRHEWASRLQREREAYRRSFPDSTTSA